ncbi:flavin monoamine oxidase family protein [Geodermatophilus sp. SYSU D00708]
MMSRRSFLRSVGVAGGAGVLFETMGALGLAPTPAAADADFQAPRRSDFTLTGRSSKKVLVLGAGIAGLTTAYELGKAGYDCVVLEAKDRPGGRSWTVRNGSTERDLDGHTQTASFADGQYLNAGAARIAQWMVTLDYCRELGVAIEPFANQNADAFIYHQGSAAQAGTPIRFRTARADVYGYVSELLAKATDQGALDAELSAADKDRLLDFLRGFGAIGGRTDGWAYTGTDRRGYVVDPGAGNQAGVVAGPPPSLADVLASGFGREFFFELEYGQAMMMFQPVGGMDRIVDALQRAVGADRLRYRCEVVGVTDLPDGVEVVYRDAAGRQQVERADFCVATLPPHLMARIPTNLAPSVQAALTRPRPLPVGKLGLEYGRRWWEEDARIFGGITRTDMDLREIWLPSHGYLGEGGVLLGYYNRGEDAVSYGRLDPATRARRAVALGAEIFGASYRDELSSSFSVAWHRVPYIEGGWMSWPPDSRRDYDLLLEPAGNVYFAGDWLTHLISWQAGAFLSARAVVTHLHQRVMSG